jgi:hypothetical protein
MYIKWIHNKMIISIIYVDDFRVASSDEQLLKEFESAFTKRFPVTKKTTDWYLGMNIIRDKENGTTTICQTAFIDEMLEKYGMTNCAPADTPAATGIKFEKTDTHLKESDKTFPYSEAIGDLLWCAYGAHPAIHYIVNQLGSHSLYPSSLKIQAIKRVMRYLKLNRELGITYRQVPEEKFKLKLIAYSDADFANEAEGNDTPMRSLSGHVIFIQGVGPIAFKTKLQDTIAQSTMESEYVANSLTARVTSSIRQQLEELGFPDFDPSVLCGDSQAAIKAINKAISSARTRHIKIAHHYIRELIANKEIQLVYVPSVDNIADILTKALPREQFLYLRDYLQGITPLPYN